MQSWNSSLLLMCLRAVLFDRNLMRPRISVSDLRAVKSCLPANVTVLLVDKDNTVTAPYALHCHPAYQNAWNDLKRDRSVYILSNSAGTLDDVDNHQALSIEASLGVQVVRHSAKKPGGGDQVFAEFLLPRHPGLRRDQVAVVGDRLLTDVLFANIHGMVSVYCRDIITEDGDNFIAAKMRRWEHWWLST